MKLAVDVKTNQSRDQLLWDGTQLIARIRAVPQDGEANRYLIDYLSGSLRVARSLIIIKTGQTSRHKLIEVDVPEANLREQLEKLPQTPSQSQLFES
jgi:uncharacterized protein YggU (UPF0235/DUF167 family)